MKKAPLMLRNIHLKPDQIHKLRGFVGNVFSQHDLIHNHNLESGRVIYRYPLIQFKLIEETPAIVSITEEAVSIFREIFMRMDLINIDGFQIPVSEKELRVEEDDFGYSEETFMYKFESPWLGLNQKNYRLYKEATNDEERKALLRKSLTGNILSMSKSLDYRLAPDQILRTDISLRPAKVQLKRESMLGFTGVFKTSFMIPDHLGLGKSVSRGFGVVKKLV